jgi:hypothetical protein
MWPANEFLTWLEDQISVSIENGQAENNHDGFLLWCLKNHFHLSDAEAHQAIAISGKGDSGVDAAWTKNDRFWIVQAKTSNPITENSSFNDKPAKELFSALLALSNPGAGASTQLRALSAFYEEAVNQGRSVELVCLVSGQEGKGLTRAIDRMNAEFRRDRSRRSHHARVVQQKDLNRSYVESLAGGAVGPVELPILRGGADPSYHFLSPAHDAVAVDAPASAIANWVGEHSFSIVARNLRYPLYSKYNEGMLNTLRDQEERQNFWLYNNGTTVVCDSFTHVPATGAKPAHFLIRGAQIVNGCQTAFTLLRFLEESNDVAKRKNADLALQETRLLVRLISTEGAARDARRIAQYTNSQNAIGPRDLVSNDEVHAVLQRTFADAGYFYERKEGEWAAMRGKGKRAKAGFTKGAVDNESLGQLSMAFWLQKPQEAKNEKKLLFARGSAGHYDAVFAPDNPAKLTMNELLVPHLIDRILGQWLQNWLKANKPKKSSRAPTIRRYEVAKNADLFLLALTGRALKRAYALDHLAGPGSAVADTMRTLVERLELSSKKGRRDAMSNAVVSVADEALDLLDSYCADLITSDPDLTPRRILVRRSTYGEAGFGRLFSADWEKAAAKLLPAL